MTGFARRNGEVAFETANFNWFFEMKSVNGKSLDVKVKLPNWLENLSLPMKNIAAKYFVRGNISVCLEVSSISGGEKVKINNELLMQIANAAIDLQSAFGDKLQKPSTSELLSIRGVVDVEEVRLNEDEQANFESQLIKGFEAVCQDLQKDRQAEGAKIKQALLDIVVKIDMIVQRVEKIAQTLPEKLKEKLLLQIETLLGSGNQITEERLAQEVTLYVARADVKEEIDRLEAHIKTARDLLNSNEAVGRRLDFLCQELNREANTTCSKSCDIELTNLGMELKTLIEQLREQVQNME